MLKKDEGWTSVIAGRSNPLHNWYYVRPGCSVKEGTLGVDYFPEEVDAFDFAKKNPECLKSLHSEAVSVHDGSPAFSSVASSAHVASSVVGSPVGSDVAEEQSAKAESPATASVEESIEVSDDESVSPFEVKDCEDCWWLNEPMPKSRKVWGVLKRKLKVKYNGEQYMTPDGKMCKDVEEMQVHFCQTGLPRGSAESLTAQEMKLVTRFVSLAHMPKKIGKFRLDHKSSVEIFTHLLGGSTFSKSKAWDGLCEYFGAKMLDGGEYFVNDIGDSCESRCFGSVEEIQQAIRDHGLDSKCGQNVHKDECHAALVLWSSVLPLPPNEDAEMEAPSEDKIEAEETIEPDPHEDTDMQDTKQLDDSTATMSYSNPSVPEEQTQMTNITPAVNPSNVQEQSSTTQVTPAAEEDEESVQPDEVMQDTNQLDSTATMSHSNPSVPEEQT